MFNEISNALQRSDVQLPITSDINIPPIDELDVPLVLIAACFSH